MRITMIAAGSRGDVQPFVALGCGLQEAGHAVTIAASADFAHFVADHGLGFHAFDVSIADQLRSDSGSAWIADSAGRPFRELRHMRRVYAEAAEPLADGLLGLAGTADLFVSGILTFDALASLAAHDRAAHAIALLCPIHPSADGRSGLTALNPRTERGNLSRTRTGRWLLARSAVQAGRLVRRRLGLPETGPKGFARTLDTTPTVLGASPLLLPRPADWPATVTVTGPWTLPVRDDCRVPAELTDFLDAGPAPVYLGFGSMSVVQPERIREVAIAAARAAGVRLVLAGTDLIGPAGPAGADNPDVFGVRDVPHDRLLPHVSAAVHHGGAGTTHAALLAGVPQFAVPHIADQPYWGRRIHEEGLGPAPLPLNRLTVDALAERLRTAAGTEAQRARAARLGEQARAERGVRDAVRTLLDDVRAG